MGTLIGLAAGCALAWIADQGFLASVALIALGLGLGVGFDRRRRFAAPGAAPSPDVAGRLAHLERRLDAVDAAIAALHAGSARRDAGALADPYAERPAGGSAAADAAAVVPFGEFAPAAAPTAAVERVSVPDAPAVEIAFDPGSPPPRPAYGVASTAAAPVAAAERGAGTATDTRVPGRSIWAWFTEGHTMTRAGVVILFFGVAFLLAWLKDHLTLSIGTSLSLVALAGAVLVALGAKLAISRPGYGLSLEGAGAGILYLATFAAARLYDLMPPVVAMVALAAVAALTVALAWRADSQALAALAIAGGFLAPVLVSRNSGAPAALFAWFAVLNAAVFALAWHRAWRALNALGAVFTFGIGFVWGWRFYVPAHFAVAQPFLALFLAFYLGVAILYAKRAPLEDRKPVDALVVFGVPVAAFVLQAGLVSDHRYGAAYAAAAFSVLYLAMFAALRTRAEPGVSLLARSFLALAVVFATVAIPFAFDARWTSAWWALEAAAVYWVGCAQDQRRLRGFALALQGAAAVAFAFGGLPRGTAPVFANAHFLGAAMIGVAALVSAWSADRHRAVFGQGERSFVAVMMAWGIAWWLVAGLVDVARARPGWLGPGPGNAALAWVIVSVAGALALARAIDWPRLAWFGAALSPAIVLAFVAQFHDARTTLPWPGYLVWPAAWLLHWVSLRMHERDGEASPPWLEVAHAASAVALVAWVAWEASEWTGRTTPRGTVWIACAAALPGVLALAATRVRALTSLWPVARHPEAYLRDAGRIVAFGLVVWLVGTSAGSPGTAAPLPWFPLANPLDATLAATLVVTALWARDHASISTEAREHALGVALFVAGNGFILRVAHQWGGVPWRLSALLANKPVQAALTLAWTATALVLMVWASRRASRARWLTGAALLFVVVVKLFVVDLAALSGLPRVAAFLGVGAMLLAVGYFAPPPSAGQAAATSAGSATPDEARNA